MDFRHTSREWRIHPAPNPPPLHPNDKVFIRSKSADIGKHGVVTSEETNNGRVLVQWKGQQGGVRERSCRVSRLVPVYGQRHTYGRSGGEEVGNDEELNCPGVGVRSRPSTAKVPSDKNAFGKTGGIVVLTAETHHYRLLASSQIRTNDRILEIGCSTGECSAILSRYAKEGSLVGFDTSAGMIRTCQAKIVDNETGARGEWMRRCRRVRFERIDPFLDPVRAAEKACWQEDDGGGPDDRNIENDSTDINGTDGVDKINPNVVFVDIGGNRDALDVMRMVSWCLCAFRQVRLMVVKSRELVRMVTSPPPALGDGRPDDTKVRKRGRDGNCSRPLVCDDGLIENGDTWFGTLAKKLSLSESDQTNSNVIGPRKQQRPPNYEHPLKAPLALSPLDGTTPICRYRNYHPDGCKKETDGECPYDHTVCHWCLKSGHRALQCEGR